MKTERRHELQQNELAQQIDQFGDYARRNANRLLAVGVGVLVVIIAGYWVIKSRESRIMDGWATLSDTTLAADPASAIDRYRAVAAESGNAQLTISAWLRVGETAMSQIITEGGKKDSATSAPATAAKDWRKAAEEAYQNVVRLAGSADTTAKGQALMMLGVLAEDRGEFEEARKFYAQIKDNKQFEMTPLPDQAEFRMAGLAHWSKPVSFPPASVTVPAPEPAAQTGTPSDQNLIMSQTIDLRSGKAVDGNTNIPVIIETQAPTTQPATGGGE